MPLETLIEIVRYARVERLVGAFQNVNVVHAAECLACPARVRSSNDYCRASGFVVLARRASENKGRADKSSAEKCREHLAHPVDGKLHPNGEKREYDSGDGEHSKYRVRDLSHREIDGETRAEEK